MADEGGTGNCARRARLVVYALAWLLCLTLVLVYSEIVGPGIPPDEIAHASYVAELAETGGLPIPDFVGLRLLERDGSLGDLPTTLVHPPLYYLLLRLTLPSGAEGLDRATLIRRLRQTARVVGFAALTLFLWLGLRLPAPLPAHLVYASAVVTTPMLCFGAAGVSNDALAWLAGGLTLLGLCRLLEERPTPATAILVASGLGLALLAKLTAALLCGATAAGVLALVWWRRPARRRTTAVVVLAIVLASAPGLAYHGTVWARYGRLLPPVPRPVVAGASNDRLSPVGWASRFVDLLGVSFVNVVGHRFTDRDSPLEASGLLLLPLLAGVGLVLRRGEVEGAIRPTVPLLRVAALAGATTLLVHFVFSYRVHLATGYLGGVQARYYFPLLPAALLLAARPFAIRRRSRTTLVAALVVVGLLAYSELDLVTTIVTDPLWHVPL